MRPHQDGLRRILLLSRPDAETLRQRGDLGDGEDGGRVYSLLRRARAGGSKDEEKCNAKSQQALILQAGVWRPGNLTAIDDS
ncbi:hypothetical protein BTJ68_04159 [Hortaea werneckii EXF-2000]|uniref:Uncharacterized protein n=1 Tax=Hortaea werneckii EXF-2000 TaxID=1157616 RepID=A0A1Z5TIP2_HORWE|nr:hypothetical protein BTJ68_04159 [Hortaea werneckii EXF-2000]